MLFRSTLFKGSSQKHSRDYREDELFVTIESLRYELLQVAEQRSLSDRTVLELSQKLDGYILLAQNRMMENLRGRKKSISINKAMVHQ